MSNPYGGNGGSPKHTPDDDENHSAIVAVAHRDPEAFLDLVDALDRLLSSGAGKEPFSPCTDPCPLCHPALWLANSG